MFGLASPNISIWPWRLELRRDLLYPRKPVLDEEEEEELHAKDRRGDGQGG